MITSIPDIVIKLCTFLLHRIFARATRSL